MLKFVLYLATAVFSQEDAEFNADDTDAASDQNGIRKPVSTLLEILPQWRGKPDLIQRNAGIQDVRTGDQRTNDPKPPSS